MTMEEVAEELLLLHFLHLPEELQQEEQLEARLVQLQVLYQEQLDLLREVVLEDRLADLEEVAEVLLLKELIDYLQHHHQVQQQQLLLWEML